MVRDLAKIYLMYENVQFNLLFLTISYLTLEARLFYVTNQILG